MVIDRFGGGVIGAECGGGVCFDLRDAGDWFYFGGDGEAFRLFTGGGGVGSTGDGALAGSGGVEVGVVELLGSVGVGECSGLLQSIGGILLWGGGVGGGRDGLVAVGRASGGGGAYARGEGGGVIRFVGVCGKVSGDCGAFALWWFGGVIRNAWGDFAQWGLVFAGGGAFGAGRVEG